MKAPNKENQDFANWKNDEKGSQEQINRVKKDWERMAQEPINVEYIKGTFYGYGSELACLKIFMKYNIMERNFKTNTNYSGLAKSWYFRLETDL
jgi:hypothetical protein